jgi:mannonate dehydratase
MGMRIAVGQGARATDEYLSFARQIGVQGVQFNTPDLPGDHRWEESDIVALRERVESFGLRLEAIENLPNHFYERSMLGLEGRDEEIEHVIATVHNLGRAGVPVLGFNWLPGSVWRTSLVPDGRGGATVSGFDLSTALDPARRDDIYIARRDRRVEDQKDSWTRGALFDLNVVRSDDEMWASFEYFMDAVIPEAEKAGVCVCVHPDDPPVLQLDGVARIFRNVDAFRRATDRYPGPGFGIELCLGTVSEMGGQRAVLDAIELLGPRRKITYVHLRDVKGVVPDFVECFLGEGNYDPATVIRALHAVRFDGFILDDHTPSLVGDSAYGHRGRAFALGYIEGLIDMLNHDETVGVRT